MSLVFPLFIVTQMISAGGVGVGVSAAVARALGAGRRGEAEALAWQAVWLAVAAAALVGVGMLAGGPALYRAFGAHGGALTAAISYSNLVFAGGIAVWLMNLLANVVRGTGHMAVAAGAIIAGEAVHLVASPVLILGSAVSGARRGGCRGRRAGLLHHRGGGAGALSRGGRRGRLVRAAMAPRLDLWGMVLRIGAFAGLTMLMTQAITVVVTSMVAGFGSAALAGYGAAQRLELLQTPITFGLGSAAIAMIAANLGGGREDRARAVARASVLIAAAIGLLFGAAALLLPRVWMALFVTDPAAAAAGLLYLRTVGWTLPLLGAAYGLAFALMGAGRAGLPAMATALRLATVLGGGWFALAALGDGMAELSAIVAGSTVLFCVALALGDGRLFRRAPA